MDTFWAKSRMALPKWLVVIFGLSVALANSHEPSFPGYLQLNQLTKPLRVLGVFPYNGYSHFIMFQSLMVGLANRGHNVTVVSPFPLKTAIGNYTDVDVSDRFPSLNNKRSFEQAAAVFDGGLNTRVMLLGRLSGPQLCRDTFTHPKMAPILRNDNQFDVVFTEVFASDCFTAIGHVLQIPTINMVSAETLTWMHDYTGECDHPAITKSHFLRFSDLGSVAARLANTFYYVASRLVYHFEITRPSDAVVREVFGDGVPSLAELRYNVSLVMRNTHSSIFGARPSVPRALHVGGIHLRPHDPQKVPQDIRTWLDTAPSGVLYFSLGSLVEGESLPARLRHVLVEAFAALRPLRVLWKFDRQGMQAMANLSDNVKVAKWLPQLEVLSHPNVLAFMTHAGVSGVIESVYYGVPMVAMPIFADQLINTFALEQRGCAVRLDHASLTKDDVVEAVLTATTDPAMRRRAKELSGEFRDRPMSPLDSAIWWTEYVVRHGGAPHLESPTARMPLWQYALLDVAFVAIALLLAILALLYACILFIMRVLAYLRPTEPVSKKKL